MKLTALLTFLCASTSLAATNYVLQVDGTIKAYGEGDLEARQQFESCCATKFQPPCGCGTDCPSCGVSTRRGDEKEEMLLTVLCRSVAAEFEFTKTVWDGGLKGMSNWEQ